jgi:hypothetical protein
MTTNATLAAPVRASKRAKPNPIAAGLPDPRPITDYDVVYAEVAGKSRITITLKQPCVIRSPAWSFIDVSGGEGWMPTSVSKGTGDAATNTIIFDFSAILPGSVCFVDVPYQDTQVQNFSGGFVRPGAKWFRSPK